MKHTPVKFWKIIKASLFEWIHAGLDSEDFRKLEELSCSKSALNPEIQPDYEDLLMSCVCVFG